MEEPNMSKPKDEPITDELVIAAVDRAQRHSHHPDQGVPRGPILEHLDIPRRAHRARQVTARLGELCSSGALEQGRRHGMQTWTLTSAGERQLARARAAGVLPQLPESPQHRYWRQAQTVAAQEIERFRRDLEDLLAATRSMLDAEPPAHSDAWLQTGERLQRACKRLGSAVHCLREWPEPTDEYADSDEQHDPDDAGLDPGERAKRRTRRTGRRNFRLWHD
jgi:hypothetical protein